MIAFLCRPGGSGLFEAQVEQPHMDATDALVIAAEPIGVQNELKSDLSRASLSCRACSAFSQP